MAYSGPYPIFNYSPFYYTNESDANDNNTNKDILNGVDYPPDAKLVCKYIIIGLMHKYNMLVLKLFILCDLFDKKLLNISWCYLI